MLLFTKLDLVQTKRSVFLVYKMARALHDFFKVTNMKPEVVIGVKV